MVKARTLETPGAAPAASTAPAAASGPTDQAPGGPAPDAFQANATTLGDDAPDAGAGDETDLRAVVAAQAKQIAALLGAVQNMQRSAAAPANMPASIEHPKLEDLDLAKITAPTMTDKGWYVPPTFGAIPNGQKA